MHYYHATDPDNIESIISNGFRLKYYDDEASGARYPVEGCLGSGVYVSKRWQAALDFGRALLRVQLTPGTKILDVSDEPNIKVINSLKREFGKDILSDDMVIHEIIPNNKQLKCSELIQLTKYHYHRTHPSFLDRGRERKRIHGPSLCQCLSMLRRYKYDGFGHSTSDVGIMMLSPEKVNARELVAVIRDRPYHRGKRQFDSIDNLRNDFHKNGEQKYIILAEQISRGDG